MPLSSLAASRCRLFFDGMKSLSVYWRRLLLTLLMLLMTTGISAAEITVFAAASLTDALKAIAQQYQKESPDKVFFNFGASSLLARQIEEGAPADVFFSADEAKMDALEQKRHILKGTRKSRLSNTLVIVVAADRGAPVRQPKDLSSSFVKRIALAEPTTVPAGIYAREYLQKLGLWEALKPKVIPTENVRAALAAVESGNVDVAIVYKTDAAISRKVQVAYEVPLPDGPKISYPLAILRETKQLEASRHFLEYLNSRPAAQVFERFGFIVLKEIQPQ